MAGYIQQLIQWSYSNDIIDIFWAFTHWWKNTLKKILTVKFHIYYYINLGGPLVCNVDGKATLTGVVSWAYLKCGTYPTVFARVTHVLSWIKDNLVTVKMYKTTFPEILTCRETVFEIGK